MREKFNSRLKLITYLKSKGYGFVIRPVRNRRGAISSIPVQMVVPLTAAQA